MNRLQVYIPLLSIEENIENYYPLESIKINTGYLLVGYFLRGNQRFPLQFLFNFLKKIILENFKVLKWIDKK